LGAERFIDELTSDRFVNREMTSRALKEIEYFFQDEWSISDKWMVSAGVRTDFSRQFGLMYMPKIAVKYTPNAVWAFRTSLSRGYRSPTIKELFFNWDHLGMFMIVGNEDLKPEKNNYVSIGAEYASDRFFINTTFCNNYFTDKIEGIWRIYDMQYNFEYTNLGGQNLLSGELLSRLKLFNRFSLNASYSYVNVSKEDGLQFNATSPHAATCGVQYSYMKGQYALTGGFTASYMGRKQFDVQDRLYIASEGGSREAYFRCDLPAYTLCNVTLAQTFWQRFKVTCGIDNIFNYKPETLGSGLTAFSVPATAGARCHVQIEFKIDKLTKGQKKGK
jgi:outer membrane receptor for ferrienterochelin and colicin